MKIGAVILAGGASQRFGHPKQLVKIEGKPMLQHVVDAVQEVQFERIALVLGANAIEIEAALTLDKRVKVVNNPAWQEGQSSSVRVGVQALEEDCDAIMFFLGDQPFVSRHLIEAEINEFREKRPEILVPIFGGVRGNPVIFGQICYSDLMAITGDQGGRAIFPKFTQLEMHWDDPRDNRDIDAPEDLAVDMNLSKIAHSHLSAIILAAGLSSRMQKPKLVLPWGERTILGTVIAAYQAAGVEEIVVVTGGHRELVEKEAAAYQVRTAFNPRYENGEMADSLKAGLAVVQSGQAGAVFVALGDQPDIASYDIEKMAELYLQQKPKLIIPSYQMRRGHPWLVDRTLWPSVMALQPPKTLRDFIEENKNQITYYVVERSRILEDLDTPEDYEKYRPRQD